MILVMERNPSWLRRNLQASDAPLPTLAELLPTGRD